MSSPAGSGLRTWTMNICIEICLLRLSKKALTRPPANFFFRWERISRFSTMCITLFTLADSHGTSGSYHKGNEGSSTFNMGIRTSDRFSWTSGSLAVKRTPSSRTWAWGRRTPSSGLCPLFTNHIFVTQLNVYITFNIVFMWTSVTPATLSSLAS